MAHRAPIWDMLAAVGPDRPALDPSPPNDAPQEISFDADLKALAESTMSSLGASGLAIAYNTAGSVICHLSLGTTAPPVGACLEIDHGISGLCMREGKPQICADTENYPSVDREASRALGVFSVAVVPLLHQAKVIGVVESLADRPNAFTQQSLRQLESLANQVVRRIAGGEQEADLPASTPAIDHAESEATVEPETASASEDISDQSGAEDSSTSISLASSAIEAQDSSAINSAQSDSSSTSEESVPARSSRSKVVGRIGLFVVIFILLTLFALFFVSAERHAGARSAVPANSTSDPISSAGSTQSSSSKNEIGTISALSAGENDGLGSEIPDAPKVEIPPAGSRTGVSQLAFGKHFESDEAGNRDLVKACTWYILASKEGNQEAQEALKRVTSQLKPIDIGHVRYNVGKAYSTGSGTPRDVVNAYFWLQLADAAGDMRAQGEESKLAADMSAPELERARQMAIEWLAKHHQRALNTEQTSSLH